MNGEAKQPEAFHWWIDAVGGFLTFTKHRVRIGQAGGRTNDIAILADISSHHADLRIDNSGSLLLPFASTTVNGRSANGFLLRDQDKIQMRGVELTYHQPISWSSTARLELTSRHRLPMALDGVILLGQTCILGSQPGAHIRTPWPDPVFVNWHRGQYWVRCKGAFEIDGQKFTGSGPLTANSQVQGTWGAFRWEPCIETGGRSSC